jgi:hypothetical protein
MSNFFPSVFFKLNQFNPLKDENQNKPPENVVATLAPPQSIGRKKSGKVRGQSGFAHLPVPREDVKEGFSEAIMNEMFEKECKAGMDDGGGADSASRMN